MKQNCVIFGNCQCSGVKKFLEFSNFYEIYDIYQYANWQIIKDLKLTDDIIKNISEADLIIYQPLKDVYNCYSTNRNNPNSFFNLTKNTCKFISFPRIHNNAIFPIFHKKKYSNYIYGYIKNKINSLEELIYLYDNNLLDFDFENRMKTNYLISKEKETDCNIKIIDFIYDNIKTYKLFLTQDHPTSIIFNEITSQICKILSLNYDYEKGLNSEENLTCIEDSTYSRKDCQYPISKYMINYFNFNYISKEHPDANEFYKEILINSYRNNLI
jgi:hypothetical protein